MFTNTQGQSDIVINESNTWNKVIFANGQFPHGQFPHGQYFEWGALLIMWRSLLGKPS